MRINMSMERYDIHALDEVYKTADNLNKKSQILETLGAVIRQKLIASSDEFTTINYSRIEEASANYLKKMKLMREELEELSKSCHEFAEKIADIWS